MYENLHLQYNMLKNGIQIFFNRNYDDLENFYFRHIIVYIIKTALKYVILFSNTWL